MVLSPPRFVVWLFSTVLVALVLTTRYAGIDVPTVGPFVQGKMFETLLIAYFILWLGTLFRGV